MKLELIVEVDDDRTTFTFDGPLLRIGCDDDCQLRFDEKFRSVRFVSGWHATIGDEADGVKLTDLGSTNGTFVNGRRVETTTLAASDVVTLGRSGPRLKVSSLVALPAVAPPPAAAVRVEPTEKIVDADESTRRLPALELKEGASPAEGYTLRKLLGKGAFGQVWLAAASGGVDVAIKFVFIGGGRAESELRGLRSIRSVRHPNLVDVQLALERDGWLIVVMPLCDGTLMDRFHECVRNGMIGIPRDELLDYMADAARGLDFLNEPRHLGADGSLGSILHRDVKPQNLLLSGGAVRVADFGIAKLLSDADSNDLHTCIGTQSYAAPEVYNSGVSPTLDQYCLAATYFHLRTGKHYDEGGEDVLTPGERAALATALDKIPASRWPNCRQFVERLRETPTAVSAAAAPPIILAEGASPTPGYTLRKMLGKGGFGQVWQASAPGGVEVAIKFVAVGSGGAAVERRALDMIVSVRHPNLVDVHLAF
ncbi:MAG: protein kinase domain-containing protein, partial [Planctomycetia bacterium]